MARDFWAADCETDPFLFDRVPKPFLWAAYKMVGDRVLYHEFLTPLEFVEFFRNKKEIVYFHNGGKFDFHFLADYFEKNKKILMINSRLVKCHIGECEFRDSYALFPMPQKDFAGKEEIDDWSIFEKENRQKHWATIQARVKKDVEGLWHTVKAFTDEYGMHLTAPGAAIKILCKMEGIKIKDENGGIFDAFNKFYFGGRCEAFKKGKFKDVTYLDLNSAYAAAMCEKHAFGNTWETTNEENPKIKATGFYTITAKSYGAFCRKENGLKFDWDGEAREYNVTGWELLAAVETGKCEILEHHEQHVFSDEKDYSTFIHHFYSIRKASKKGTLENVFAKLIPNSSYGKLSANPEHYQTFMFVPPDLVEFLQCQDWDIAGEIGDNIVMSTPMQENQRRYYNVATGASITGFVRSLILRALPMVECPLYCDTDSLIFTGGHSLPLGDKLGQWKLEGEFDKAYIGGKKLYAVENKKERKIARKGSKLTFEDIKEVVDGKIVTYKQDAPVFSWKKKLNLNDDSQENKDKIFLVRKIKMT